MKESAELVSEQADVCVQYFYERLGHKRFQQLCAALLKLSHPNATCYPVGHSDGGREVGGRTIGVKCSVHSADHLVALARAGARLEGGQLVERPEAQVA